MNYLEPVSEEITAHFVLFSLQSLAGSIFRRGKMKYIVFLTTNVVNNKIYVGKHSIKDVNKDDGYRGSGETLKKAFKKHGKKNFNREILFTYDTEEEAYAKEAEIVTEEFVAREDTYNIQTGGLGSCVHSEETKRKISLAISGENNPNYGKHTSEETRQKISEALSGSKHPMHGKRGQAHYNYGKKHSEETKRKISLATSGENNPNYGKCGEKSCWFGKEHSEETKEKMSNSQKGHKVSEETKIKMREAKGFVPELIEQRRKDIFKEPKVWGW